MDPVNDIHGRAMEKPKTKRRPSCVTANANTRKNSKTNPKTAPQSRLKNAMGKQESMGAPAVQGKRKKQNN
jgi:hypothetical protein